MSQQVFDCPICDSVNTDSSFCTHQEQSQHKTQPEFFKKTTPGSVVIHVEKKLPESPHLVDLAREQQKTKRLENISVFREKMQQMGTPQTIDVAQIVRQSNERVNDEVYKKILNKQKKEPKLSRSKESFGVAPNQGEVDQVKRRALPRHDGGQATKQGHSRFSLPKLARKKFKKEKKDSQFAKHKAAFSIKRFALSVAVFTLLIGLPFPVVGYVKKVKHSQEQFVNQGTNAFVLLQSSTMAALQANMPIAQQGLQQALQGFSAAESILNDDHQILTAVADIIPVLGTQLRSGRMVLQGGQHLALGNTYLVKGLSEVSQDKEAHLSDKIKVVKKHLTYAIPQYERALEEIGGVSERVLPLPYQASFKEVKLLLATFVDDLRDIRDLTDAMLTLFGGEELKRYLVIFQNHHEIRPTGGFMGSFALVDVQKGKIVNIEVPEGGTYDLKGQLDTHVKAPLPLQLVNGRWEFQDANWFPDFPKTAQKVVWFYEHARGATVDGVIAVNATVLERFLKVTGEVDIQEEYDILLDADTALAQVQTVVETGEDKKVNKPKRIISVVLRELLDTLPSLEKVQIISLLSEVHDSVQEKEIQVYSTDQKIQNKLEEFGWTGKILPVQDGQDYLYVVNTNLQGQKSDAKMKQKLDYVVEVKEDGHMYATATIKREHTGRVGEQFYGNPNINFLRIYVPKGAELIDAGGFTFPPEKAFHTPEEWYSEDEDLMAVERERGYHDQSGTRITEEFDKTVFGNWLIVNPGEQASAYFTYKLPYKANMTVQEDSFLASIIQTQHRAHRYSLLLQKQSGVKSSITARLIYPDGWEPVWKSEEGILFNQDGYTLEKDINQDQIIGVVMKTSYD